MPVGVVSPTITILDAGRVAGAATVDLDAVRRAKDRGWSDPLAYVSGVARNSRGRQAARRERQGRRSTSSPRRLGGVPIPKALLQEIVSYYSRTPESPGGFTLDQPFDLPQKIRQVELQRGSAVIVQ